MTSQTINSPLISEQRASHASPLRLSHKLLIVAYGLSLLLIGLGVRTLTRHEVLAAYPAKEMLGGGSWIIPGYAGIPRTAKPPGMYWIIASFMDVFNSDVEWVPRLPSALAAVALALMVASFAARFYSPRVGLIAGLVQMTSVYVLVQARLAEADMLLVLLVTAALFIFAGGPVADVESGQSPRRWLLSWRPIVFYLLLGLTFLLKGLVGIGFVLPGAILYAIFQRDRSAARFLLNPIGIILLLLMAGAWPLAAYLKYPAIWESWRFEQFGRLVGERGSDSPFYYLYEIPFRLLPWTPLIIFGAWLGYKKSAHRRPLTMLFLCFFLFGLISLSVPPFKHHHYAYPILPPLSILAAVGLLEFIAHQHRHLRPRHGLAAIIFIITCIGVAIAAFYMPRAKLIANYVALLMGLLMAGGLAAIYMEHRKHTAGQLGAIFATAWVLPVLVQLLIIPTLDDYKSEAALARAANKLVDRNETIYIIDPAPRVEPHCAYYLRPPIRRFRDVNDFLKNGPARPDVAIHLWANIEHHEKLNEHGRSEILLRRHGWIKPRKHMEPVVIEYIRGPIPTTQPAP
jgi:4-amino-4-deoxy-L-arabinose transferase-like glycosyltransferase